ncbi:MAG TPA: hypothetical protein VF092_27495 [Longimicrobium sp.]
MKLRTRLTLAICVMVSIAAPLPAQTRMVFPHFVERAGSITNTLNTFDTNLYILSYRTGELQLFLYDTNAAPIRAAGGAVVCEPCRIPLVKRTLIRIEDLIVAAGGMPQTLVSGFIEIRLAGGATFDALAVQGFIVSSRTSQFDLQLTPIQGMMVTVP